MKSPDITLLLQATHFFIAYYVLRTYVFYPAMAILNKEEERDEKLQEKIRDALVKRKVSTGYMQERWAKIKQTLHAMIPNTSRKLISLRESKQAVSLSDKDIELSDIESQRLKKLVSKSLMDVKQ